MNKFYIYSGKTQVISEICQPQKENSCSFSLYLQAKFDLKKVKNKTLLTRIWKSYGGEMDGEKIITIYWYIWKRQITYILQCRVHIGNSFLTFQGCIEN